MSAGERSKSRAALRAALGLAAVLGLAPVEASSEPEVESWLEGPHFTGNWGGARERLAENGLFPHASYTSGFWSNLSGGFETGTRYEGFAEWALEGDLETMAGWSGGSFKIDMYSYHGGEPSADLIGPFDTQTVSGDETATPVARFYEIFLQKTWREGRILAKLGQLAADSDFFISDYAGKLLNGAFGFLGLSGGLEVAPFHPLAAPGAYLRAATEDRTWAVHAGVYTADVGDDELSNFGFGWGFDNGVTFLGELRTRRTLLGRRGRYTVGIVATTADLAKRGGFDRKHGFLAFFGMIDQVLIDPADGRPGLAAFLRSYGSPQDDRLKEHWYVDAGLELSQPLPGRSEDTLSVGWSYLSLTNDFVRLERDSGTSISKRGGVVEVAYRAKVTGWLTLQPDFQFFFDPHYSRRDATVIGLRAVITL